MTRVRLGVLLALAVAGGLVFFAVSSTEEGEARGGCRCDGPVQTAEGAYTFRFKNRDYPVDVHRAGGPSRGGILLLHEAPGMTPGDICLAKRLALEGYVVHMPLFFGKRGDQKPIRNMFLLNFHPGFGLYSASNTAPISDGLEQVVERLYADSGDRPIAVIGMCLTGPVPLNLLTDVRVAAGVLSQPAVPVFKKRSLGVSEQQVAAVKATGKPILAHRFKGDGSSPAARLDVLRVEFEGQIETHEFDGDGHSVLGADCREEHLALTLRFLSRTLGRRSNR